MFQLKNNMDMALSFRLSTHPPFSVLLPRQSLKLISSSPSHRHTTGLSGPGDEQTSLLLQPKQIMQVILFLCSFRFQLFNFFFCFVPVGICAKSVLFFNLTQKWFNNNFYLQVKVAFHNSASLLTSLNEPCEESDAQPSATLLCNDAGERTLQFQQSLTIQYSNNSVQVCTQTTFSFFK